jgi:hypothetical protein
MPCVFTEREIKTVIDSRKLLLLRRGSKKYPGKQSVSYYIPLYEGEVRQLGLGEDSLVRAEVSRIERSESVKKPAHELQAELDRLREGLKKILDGYDESTSIRKTVLQERISKVIGIENYLDITPSLSSSP